MYMYEDHTITRKINLMRMFMLMREIRFNITAYMIFATMLSCLAWLENVLKSSS